MSRPKLRQVCAGPPTGKTLRQLRETPPPGRAGFDQFLAEDRKLWEPAVKASGVKLD